MEEIEEEIEYKSVSSPKYNWDNKHEQQSKRTEDSNIEYFDVYDEEILKQIEEMKHIKAIEKGLDDNTNEIWDNIINFGKDFDHLIDNSLDHQVDIWEQRYTNSTQFLPVTHEYKNNIKRALEKFHLNNLKYLNCKQNLYKVAISSWLFFIIKI